MEKQQDQLEKCHPFLLHDVKLLYGAFYPKEETYFLPGWFRQQDKK